MSGDAYIFDAVRSPRGKGKSTGSLNSVKPVSLLAQSLSAIQSRNSLDTSLVDDVMIGCVTPVGDQGGNIAKAASLYAGWDYDNSGLQLNKFCASGLQAINLAAARISSGMEHCLIAGGVESMSRVPMTSDGGPMAFDPETNAKVNFVPQGISADLLATLNGISRSEADEYAALSHKRAYDANANGFLSKSIVPVKSSDSRIILDHDEAVRKDTNAQSLAQLKPAFDEIGGYGFDDTALSQFPSLSKIEHVHTAGNSSAIVDGAAAVLIGSASFGKSSELKPRAKIVGYAVVGTDPTLMLDGPISATQKVLKATGLSLKDIDLFEINEAFASVVLRYVNGLNLDISKVNVNGGAIAMGHPLGATGAMITGTLLDELERQNKSIGLITLCAAGGIGIATIIKRV